MTVNVQKLVQLCRKWSHTHPLISRKVFACSHSQEMGSKTISVESNRSHFFLPPPAASSLRSHEMTLPSMTTPFPSMKATRERPSQFLKVSHTSGCCGTNEHCDISLDFSECGSSIPM